MRLIDADVLIRKICGSKCGCEYEDCGLEGNCVFAHYVFWAPTIAPPPNDPLTIDALREMDGEPVWNDTMKKWGIVLGRGERTVDANGNWRDFNDRYYRHRPEEAMK